MKRFGKQGVSSLFLLALLQGCGDDDSASPAGDGPDSGTQNATSEDDTNDGGKTSTDETEGSTGAEQPTQAGDDDASTSVISEDGGAGDTDVAGELDGGETAPSEVDGSTVTSPDADTVTTGEATTAEPEDALYALAASVYDGNAWLTYIAQSPTLATHITLNDAIELEGRALAVGPEDQGVTYVANGTSITRYRLNESDVLEPEEPSISFSGVGVTSIHEYGGQFVFHSADKSYFFDGDNSQIVVWNPEEMTVGQPIPLDLVPSELEGVVITYSAAPVKTDTKVLTFVGLRQSVVPITPTAVVVLDTEDDSAEVVTDDRCGYVRDGVLASDGWVYLATEGYAAAYQRINNGDDIAAPCLLRFNLENNQFDSEFLVATSSLVDGAAAGSLSVAKDGSVYLKVLDEALAPIAEDSNARVIASAPAWKWASLSVGETPTASLLDLAPTSGSVTPFDLGSRRIVLTNRQAEVDGATITVSDISEFQSAPTEPVGTVDGLVFSITKLR